MLLLSCILLRVAGIPDDRDGLFDTIHHSKTQHQKRAYQCIKMMVRLFIECQKAHQMLQNNADLKRKWTFAVEWLNDELEKRPYSGSAQYSYSSWSPPAQSNETSNGWVHACAGVCVCVCVCVNFFMKLYH